MNRRDLIVSAALVPVLLLPGCATRKELSLEEAIRRLLLLAASRALAMLMGENGFYNDAIARISLPDAFGGARVSNVITAILLAPGVRERLLHQANRAAEKGAERAAPYIADAVRGMPVAEALAVVRGGPEAATDLLRKHLGANLFQTMAPGVEQGLRLFDSDIVNDALRAASGIDFAAFRDDIASKATDSVYRAIAREESAIRSDPASTNDPLLIGVFGLAGRKL